MSILFRKFTAALSASAIAIGALTVSPFSASAENKKLLILGDSISVGYGLQKDEANYGAILGESLGYEVTNLAVNGATTSDLLTLLATDDAKKAVKEADLICISIGGNDLMQPAIEFLSTNLGITTGNLNINDVVTKVSALDENAVQNLVIKLTGKLRDPLKTAAANFPTIESTIRAINSDTKLVMQTVYNPLEFYTTSYQGTDFSDKYNTLQEYVNGQLLKINKPISELESVSTADIKARFDGNAWLYVNSKNKDIHPTAVGHALIASEILETLKLNVKSTKIASALVKMDTNYFTTLPDDDYALLQKYMKYPLGDLDGNSIVNEIDATYVLMDVASAMLDKEYLTAEQEAAADVNHDGTIDERDATKILVFYANNLLSEDSDWRNMLKSK